MARPVIRLIGSRGRRAAGEAGEAGRDAERAHDRMPGRPRWWVELSLIALCYHAYSMVRNLVPHDHAASVGRAYEILRIEDALHIDIEYGVNRLFTTCSWLGVTANYYYATLHFAVTLGVLVWLYVRRPARYATYRWILVATTLTALIGFWSYPLAPPRMLPGYTDTVVAFNTWGLYDSSPVATISNQYAAMPSLHTAWSLWCALAILAVVRKVWVRILAVLYPVGTIVVIMGTANHFVLDAGGGMAVLLVGWMFGQGTVRVVGYGMQMVRSTT
ncbi:PAP2 superfamily protein [Thermomonospora echinospora]|uniref:PAP2 superfamily protein n=1 Tax=Thermomonospora echinospora TaxID=1992 RepID=A0A1H5S1R0_9ACTN|nr:phosphatase PAP2 family protein [Thermomonospora echinospora]SEF44563.1 PAP2 superfamily protein [Thermomonospora echinospora]